MADRLRPENANELLDAIKWAAAEASPLEVIGAGKVDVEKFITHRFPLSCINKGFEAIESHKAIKVVINP